MSAPDEYCREIEAYLCRKNDGHLIRIVGPAFERVSGWAREGIPLKVACAGIDRYFERYYRKGPRRRPVRVEFCEADVRETFDAWRRAVGVLAGTPEAADPGDEDAASGRRVSLASHIERALARLTVLRGSTGVGAGDLLEGVVSALDGLQHRARGARGEARAVLMAQLAELDAELLARLAERLGGEDRLRLVAEARQELAPFRARMSPEAWAQSERAAFARLVREHFAVPRLTYDSR